MFAMVFIPLFSLALNAQVCAVNPASTASVLESLKPNACLGREETFVVNK